MGYFLANFLLAIVTLFNLIYDVITIPIYYVLQQPTKKRRFIQEQRTIKISENDNEVLYGAVKTKENELVKKMHEDGIDTLHKLFESISADPQRLDKPSFGTRKVIAVDEVQDSTTGKNMTKFTLGEYQWTTLRVVQENARKFGLGLRELDVEARSNVAIFADTRAEWLVASRGCFQHSMTTCTLYTNLGLDAVKYGIQLTESSTIITTQERLPRLATVLHELPEVKVVVVLEDSWRGDVPSNLKDLNPKVEHPVRLITYTQVLALGANSAIELTPPKPQDPAVIMFTSGSTGVPKGVIQTHENLVSAFTIIFSGLQSTLKLDTKDLEGETYIAFLPLAHILEYLAENCMLLLGVKIGFSSPFTLTDTGSAIKKGTRGDLPTLKPTFMCCVPVILDRIYKGILGKVQAKGAFSYKLFDYAIKYRTVWTKRGYTTPILDRLVFKGPRQATGGHLKVVICGGAPLSETTHQFVRHTLGVALLQGYGLTETCATATLMDADDPSAGVVGGPLPRVEIKLRSWPEGNYTIRDEDGPKGEIIIGGKHVASGYYKMPDATQKDFENDANGGRWFQTGDIAQMMPNGTLKIIDRKKDLVKLQMGEYVSLGKVESILKLHQVIDNMCVCALPSEMFCVAIAVPIPAELIKFAETALNKKGFTAEQLSVDEAVLTALTKTLFTFGISRGLEKFEIPRKIRLVLDDWSPDSGIVTAAMKLRRKEVETKYKTDISLLYDLLNSNNNNSEAKPFKGGKISPV